MAELRNELIGVVSTLNHIIDTQLLDTKPKNEGRVVYLATNGCDGINVYTDKDSLISEAVDYGSIADYDSWYDNLDREDIEEICELYFDCPFRKAIDKAYEDYCNQEFDKLVVDLKNDDISIHKADGEQYIRVYLA